MARKVHGRDQHDGEEQGGGMGPPHGEVGDDKALDDMGQDDEVKGDGPLKNRFLYIFARPSLST